MIRTQRFAVIALIGGLISATAGAGPDLIEAVRRADLHAVRAALDTGTDVDARGGDGSTALHWAVQKGAIEIVDALLAAGADPAAATRNGVTPLALAAQSGDAEIIARLLDAGADPNERSEEGQTALMLAARNGRPDAVRLLLDRGADVNAVEPFRGQTALMWAAGEGNADAIHLLIDHGADIDARSTGGFTALMFAARENQPEAARALVERGADLDAVAPDGTSTLNMAILNAHYDVASLLVAAGADPNLPDPRGSPLHIIAWLREPGATGQAAVGDEADAPPRPEGRVTSLELARQLLEAGADPNVRIDWQEMRFNKVAGMARNPPGLVLGRHMLTYNGATAFYVAAKNGDAPLMRLLVEYGANPLIPNRFNITPLMVAAGLDTWEGETPGPHTGVSEAERLEAVKLAVELGNDVNARADFGDFEMIGDPEYTLLYYPHNIEELADLGVGDPRWDDSTALHGSIISGQPSITRYLIEQGAEVNAKNALGWTPLMMARGVFLANASREFPAAEAILLEAMAKQGIPAE